MKILNFTKDKMDHVVYSFAICLTICLLFSFLNIAPIIAVIGTLAIGLGKEIKDLLSKTGSAELKDILADGIGIGAGIVLYLLSRMIA